MIFNSTPWAKMKPRSTHANSSSAWAAQLKFEQAKNQALNFEIARLKQWRFGSSSESLDTKQSELFESGLEAVLIEESKAEDEGADEARKPASVKRQPKRLALPEGLERIEHRYEIEPAVCALGHALKRIGEETSEQLDCVPAQFFVHLHIRGKYACVCCQTILAAAMPAQVIDKGIPAAGLLAQVIVAKFDDHLPLFRQEEIYQRSGVFIPRSSMGGWVGQCGVRLLPLVQAMTKHLLAQGVLHGDETSVKLLQPGLGKTHQAYVWAWRTSDLCTTDKAVIYDFAKSRSGENARRMLKDFEGTLVVDDYSGYVAAKDMLRRTSPRCRFTCPSRRQCAHKFRVVRYSCFMKFMIVADFPGDLARAAGRSVMSTLASALAFISRSTSA